MTKKDLPFYKRRIQHILLSFLLISFMTLIAAVIAWLLFGNSGLFFLLIIGITLIIMHPSISHKFHLKIRGARPINHINAPELYRSFKELAYKADLPSLPNFYYVPSKTLNAFSIGNKNDASVVLTSTLINYLTMPELKGVIAHEMSHIKNNDMWQLGLANTVYHFTSWLSWLGILFLLFQIPFLFTGRGILLFLPAVIILTGPFISRFLLSSLSRTREYDADIGAVRLTQDVGSFVSALKKLALQPVRLFGIFLIRTSRENDSSIFRTHPGIRQRIHRLQEMDEHSLSDTHELFHFSG
jgi:heat shock protein HtpX